MKVACDQHVHAVDKGPRHDASLAKRAAGEDGHCSGASQLMVLMDSPPICVQVCDVTVQCRGTVPMEVPTPNQIGVG